MIKMFLKKQKNNSITSVSNIRNFSIVAHVDHGKSTLAALFIQELSSPLNQNKKKEDLFYRYSLEKKKGVTFKLHTTQLYYSFPENKEVFFLNLIDTPGHIDFKNEVLLSLSVCEGVIFLVDSVKGIQAQSLLYYELIKELGLFVLPVISKIDMSNARLDFVSEQMVNLIGCKKEDIIPVSAKTKENFFHLLERIILSLPCPKN